MIHTFRLVFLGAGFSQPAGLPLGSELFGEVRRLISAEYGRDNHVERDIARFLNYLEKCEGRSESADSLEYEEFLGFLDTEHYLGLKGKDTWSNEGNESQLMIRRAIARVLYERTPTTSPALYRRFARQLNHTDWVLTFNYDTLLEAALEAEGVPYRLFPYRYSEIGWAANTIDTTRDELAVLKLHGSIDWFDRAAYERHLQEAKQAPVPYEPKHPVFGPDRIVQPLPLTDGPRPADDHLASLFRVPDLRPLLDRQFWECSPLILAPSHAKLFYGMPIREFWWGMQRAGGLNLSLGVVGYSLPKYDAYARQAMFHIFSNYTGYEPDLQFAGRRKTEIRILDYRPDTASERELRSRYRFADANRTEFWLDGFTEQSADWFLS